MAPRNMRENRKCLLCREIVQSTQRRSMMRCTNSGVLYTGRKIYTSMREEEGVEVRRAALHKSKTQSRVSIFFK